MEQEEAEGVSRPEDALLSAADAAAGVPIHPSTPSRPSLFSLVPPPLLGANTMDEADAARSSRPPQSLPSASAQSYFNLGQLGTSPVPLPELTYHFSRADKDADDPTASSQRRYSNQRSGSSTRTTLNRLFAASSPHSQPYSRQTSFLRSSSPKPSMQSLVSEGLALGTHVYNRGLLEGRHSDICLNLFGNKYRLHRLILEQAPFFASTFSGPWLESAATEIELHPEDTDTNISKEAFELALKRIYGCRDPQQEVFHCLGLFATACWLEMQELINDCAEIIIRTMQPTNLSPVINLVTSSYYGKAGDLILQSANILLRREGATIPTRSWDNIPADIIKSALRADEFFVNSEWERWCLAKRLLDRRLKLLAALLQLDQQSPTSASALRALRRAGRPSAGQEIPISPDQSSLDDKAIQDWQNLYNHADIATLYDLLDHGINYMHLDFEALQRIKAARDCFGLPVIPPALISDALWASIELRQKVLSANRQDSQIGLTHSYDVAEEKTQENTEKSPGDGLASEIPTKENPENGPADEPEQQEHGEDRKIPKYLIPQCDCNIAIGANPVPIKTSETRKRVRNPLYKTDDSTISDFVSPDTKTSSQADQMPEPACYSRIPPFRFSVEFPDPRVAEERKSLHSQTFFYAGSFWNIYIQKFRKGSKESKTPQLGVYLRRAEDGRQPDYDIRRRRRYTRSVDERIGDLERGMLLSTDQLPAAHETRDATASPSWDNHTSLMSMYNLHGPTTSPIPIGTRMSLELDAPLNSEASAMAGAMFKTESSEDEEAFTTSRLQSTVIPPYIDTRPLVKVYFKIFCPSPGGRSLNIWESVPATFSLKQSRGWKSSSLMEDAAPARTHPFGGEGPPLNLSLRGEDKKQSANNDEDGGADGSGLFVETDNQTLQNEQLRFSIVIGLV